MFTTFGVSHLKPPEMVRQGKRFRGYSKKAGCYMFPLLLLGVAVAAAATLFDFSDSNSEEDDPVVENPENDPNAEVSESDVDGQSTQTISLSSDEIGDLPDISQDWSVSGVTEIAAGNDSVLDFEFDDSEGGTLHVVDANYQEQSGNQDTDSVVMHTGLNVYFVPDGQDFPEDLQWSEQGASLYGSSTNSNDSDENEDIRLIARIDTGDYSYSETSSGESFIVFDNRMGTPEIRSNIEVVHQSA